MTRREIDPLFNDASTPLGTPHAPAEIRETLSNVAKLANIIADVADGQSDYGLHGGKAPAGATASTTSKERLGVSSCSGGDKAFDTTPLGAIGSTFDELRDTIPEVREQSAAALADVLQAAELTDKIDEIVQPIEERLLDVAWQSHALACLTPADLRVKAEILKYVANDEPDDIQSALTRSLCNDIIARTLRRSGSDV